MSEARNRTSPFAASPPKALLAGSTFPCQKLLMEAGAPTTALYGFEFRLFDNPAAESQVGSTLSVDDLSIDGRLFTTSFNFGGTFDGSVRPLEIGIRTGTSVAA